MLPPLPPPSMQRWGVLPPSPPRGRHSGDAARSHQRAAGAREIGGRRGACDIPEVSARSVARSPRAFAVGWGGKTRTIFTVERVFRKARHLSVCVRRRSGKNQSSSGNF